MILPKNKISGEEAYQLYIEHSMAELENAGSKILFYGECSHYLVGPEHKEWDAVMLVEHQSISKFMEFGKNEYFLTTAGHRTAALEDSRLLPTLEKTIR